MIVKDLFQEIRNLFSTLFGLFRKTEGYKPTIEKTKLPPWAEQFREHTRDDLTKLEFNRIVSETVAFKSFFLWNKDPKAKEQLRILKNLLSNTNRYVIEIYSHLTGIPINEMIYNNKSEEDVYQFLKSKKFGEDKYLGYEEERIDVKGELEVRWKEKLWKRFYKNTNQILQNIARRDIFHAESILMDIVFTYDALPRERAHYIKSKYLETFGVDLDRLVHLKKNEREQLKEFARMHREFRETNKMLDELVAFQEKISSEGNQNEDKNQKNT